MKRVEVCVFLWNFNIIQSVEKDRVIHSSVKEIKTYDENEFVETVLNAMKNVLSEKEYHSFVLLQVDWAPRDSGESRTSIYLEGDGGAEFYEAANYLRNIAICVFERLKQKGTKELWNEKDEKVEAQRAEYELERGDIETVEDLADQFLKKRSGKKIRKNFQASVSSDAEKQSDIKFSFSQRWQANNVFSRSASSKKIIAIPNGYRLSDYIVHLCEIDQEKNKILGNCDVKAVDYEHLKVAREAEDGGNALEVFVHFNDSNKKSQYVVDSISIISRDELF